MELWFWCNGPNNIIILHARFNLKHLQWQCDQNWIERLFCPAAFNEWEQKRSQARLWHNSWHWLDWLWHNIVVDIGLMFLPMMRTTSLNILHVVDLDFFKFGSLLISWNTWISDSEYDIKVAPLSIFHLTPCLNSRTYWVLIQVFTN